MDLFSHSSESDGSDAKQPDDFTGRPHVLGAVQGPIRSSSLEVLHLPMRSYGAFQEKIERGREYFAKNPELAQNTGWHWRRWIELFQSGRLREGVREAVSLMKKPLRLS